jgi:tape measure domain-containing protein
MPMDQQRKVFESLSRASTAFSLSAQQTDGVFLALSQMMSKGKISMEELRKQMGEKLPIAVQAMAKALGVSIAQMGKLIGSGKVMSADVLPKFADALNEMIPDVDTDNLEGSLNKLSNMFGKIVDASGFQNKYKALIDGLTSLLESASKNIQNIIVGIVAAIGFVVTNGLTKVYRGYAATGQQIVANANITHNKLRAAIAARVEAEKRLEELKLQHAQAVGRAQVALAKQVEKQKQLLSARTAQVNIAHENAKVAAAQAAAIKSRGAWATTWAAISGSAKKLMVALKSMWNTFAPAIIISAIIAIIGHFRNLYTEAKRVKAIFSDYRKELDNVKPGNEAIQLEKLRGIVNDINGSLKDRKTALDALNKILNTNYTIDSNTLKVNGDINTQIEKRIGLLKAQAKAEYLTTKLVDMENKRDELEQKRDRLTREERSSNVKGKALVRSFLGNDIAGSIGMDTSKKVQQEIDQINKVIIDANNELEQAIIDGGLNTATTTTTTPTGDDPDDKAKKAAERRLEALRKLDEEDRKRQIEKQKFDLDLRQKAIDTLDDSFEKRTKQTILNLEKEKLAIEEFQSDLLKQQSDHAKNKYVSVHGTDKGFEAYFAGLKKNNFKDRNGVDIMPEGLRPEDIEAQVGELLDAAQKAQRKGLNDINKDLSTMLREQQLMFASDLDKKLADLDAYYNEQLIKAGSNAELIAQIEANRKREKLEVTTNDKIKNLDFSEELESERAAGMESIGMTELVEEKKLEITKRYLQLRIEALQELADAGDDDAKQQIQMYQASLKKLNMQKPAKSLKALADKAIFNTIQKGFEKAGDSAEDAEEKTTNLLGSIGNKAAMVADITSTLQTAFGGMDEGLDMAMEAVGNITSGFAQGGIIGGIAAVVGEGIKLFGKASEAAARHKKALKEIEDARLASQRAYNLLLLEQNLLLKEAVSIFGEKQIRRAANAIQNYRDSLGQLKDEMQGNDFTPNAAYEQYLEKGASSGGILSKYFSNQLNDYRKQVDNYNKGVAKLAEATIVTGHKKTGLFGWGKGKDIYSSILDEYDDVIDAEGKLNIARIQNIIDTRKMSDETKNYLQNLIDLQDAAEAAQEELRNYLQSTFGALGEDIMTSLENAIKDKGIDAWEAFGKAGAKVIEELGKQIAYELFFADKFKELQNQLEAVYGSNKSEEDIAREAMDLVGKFYQNIGSQMELAQGFMENWQKEAEKYGLSLWKPEDSSTQDSTKGYSVSMDQDTGGAILGRITGIHESILEVKSMMSAVNVDTARCLTQSIAIGDELKKHTGIFYEMQQMQVKSYRISESMNEGITSLLDIKDDISAINKNTKGLAPK